MLYARDGGGGTQGGGGVRSRGLEVLGVPVALSDGHGKESSADFLQKSPLPTNANLFEAWVSMEWFCLSRNFCQSPETFFWSIPLD